VTADPRADPRSQPPCVSSPFPVHDDAPLSIPNLPPPPGARQGRSGGGFGGEDVSARAVLTDSVRTAAEIGRYYAGLLSSAGWGVAVPVADTRVSAAALDARDAKGRAWYGVLLVQTKGREHAVTVTMRTPESR
jgi:hypothetical protein